MTGRSSQRKGRGGETEIAHILQAHGIEARPGRSQSYGTEPDVLGLDGYHLEIKRVEKLNVPAAMRQSIQDSEKFQDGTPLLLHRRNREPWLCTMLLDDFLNLYSKTKTVKK